MSVEDHSPITPGPGVIVPADRRPEPRRQWVLGVTVIIFSTACVLLGGGWILNLVDRNAGLNELVASQASDLHSTQENAQRLYDQLLALGEAPDGADPQTIATPGPTGAAGEQGAPGRPPTATEVATAIEAFCASNDQCRGIPGVPGSAGAPGATGASGANGSDGIGATGPQGIQGEPGPTGAQGPAGPACPDGYRVQVVTVMVQNAETVESTPTPAAVCLPT